MRDRIFLSSPTLNGSEMKYIADAFISNWVAPLGPNVDAFEEEIQNYVGGKYALAINTGTAAMHMALRHLGVKSGDTVFCSSLTFAASCNPIVYQNATPVFIDSEPETWNMSPAALRRAFKKHLPKAVIVVHLYGTPAPMDEIISICDAYGVPVIEDAAESLGSLYKGRHTGTIGRFGIFSFNGNKIITTSGGGMILCPERESRQKILKWITQSREPAIHYEHTELGYNYRMSNILAGMGRGQLEDIQQRIDKKKRIHRAYQIGFSDMREVSMNPIPDADGSDCNCWLSCMLIDGDSPVEPQHIIEALELENIESRPIWKPMNLQPFYRDCEFFSHFENGTPVCNDLFRRGLCLPSDIKMDDEDMNVIINMVKGLFNVS